MADHPTAEHQIFFIRSFQRLLSEGQYTSTYKLALLRSICDLVVDVGRDDGDELHISLTSIAEKFIDIYWNHTRPFHVVGSTLEGKPLQQNTGRQSTKVINDIATFQSSAGRRFDTLLEEESTRLKLLSQTRDTIVKQPLWLLQKVGGAVYDFLYEQSRIESGCIVLRPGVGFCLRAHRNLLMSLIEKQWVDFVRKQNIEVLGSVNDVQEYLFGAERSHLGRVAEILSEIDGGRCFYCDKGIRVENRAVDHFIPWARYPNDFGHNFVLVDSKCNSSKSDHLPAEVHLKKWIERARKVTQLDEALAAVGFRSDFGTSVRICDWAYGSANRIGERGWVRSNEFVEIGDGWQGLLRTDYKVYA